LEDNKSFFEINDDNNDISKPILKYNEYLFPKLKIKDKEVSINIEEHEATLYKVITFFKKDLRK